MNGTAISKRIGLSVVAAVLAFAATGCARLMPWHREAGPADQPEQTAIPPEPPTSGTEPLPEPETSAPECPATPVPEPGTSPEPESKPAPEPAPKPPPPRPEPAEEKPKAEPEEKPEPRLLPDEHTPEEDAIKNRLVGLFDLANRVAERELDDSERDRLATARSFLATAVSALDAGDLQRASNLADKAEVLLRELERSVLLGGAGS